jgi:DNA-binding LytR/AlgR family response regulator
MLVQLDRPPLTVFATAYDKYAVNAFETNAIDYLLKPIEGPRLEKAVHKIRAAIDRTKSEHNPAMNRSEIRKLGARRRARFRMRS